MLTNVSRYNCFTFGRFANHLDNKLWFKFRFCFAVFQRELLFACLQLSDPCFIIRRLRFRIRILENSFHVTYARNIGLHVFADFRWIHIDVRDFLHFWSKTVQVHRYPIIKTGTDGDDEIRILDRRVRCISSVHPRHTEPQLVCTWEAA
ncbi:hypothetical protein D3C85_1381660 [compost metagenome]